jgi:hypothetical protein
MFGMSKITISVLLASSLAVSAAPTFAKGSGSHSSSSSHSYSSGTGSHSISGHVRKDGTYVAPSHATNPNGSKSDNWSSKGNTNPYTGKAGTRDPYAPSRSY